MPTITAERHQKLDATFQALYNGRSDWWPHWRELADYVLPRRYIWLLSPAERRKKMTKNPFILDGTGTTAARVLAAGLMNGITSPSRPWFKLRVSDLDLDEDHEVQVWLDEVQRRMLRVMADSNFYNSMATMYLDLVVFGTATVIIYEDFDDVIRCFNPACGEYYLGQSQALKVNTFAREFAYTAAQAAERWGEDALCEQTRAKFRKGGAALHETITVRHLIEPNLDGQGRLPSSRRWRELYWEAKAPKGTILEERGYDEFPVLAPRWEVSGNDAYGVSPSMDALGDIIQLQHETKKKGQGLDKMVDPPVIADIQLKSRPTALLPRGITYVAGVNNVGVKPAYQINMPLAELSADIAEVRARIREIFHNDLFKMISQLDTIRSATEIDARREEKLVQLGSVLERFENEGLDPAIERIFAIMMKDGLLPPPPPQLEEEDIEIQYVSILSVAQSAIGAAPTERFLSLLGEIGAVRPESFEIVNWDSMLRDYARDIGVRPKNLAGPEAVEAARRAAEERLAAQEAANVGRELVQGAKTLSETDVGGGANALQRLLGG